MANRLLIFVFCLFASLSVFAGPFGKKSAAGTDSLSIVKAELDSVRVLLKSERMKSDSIARLAFKGELEACRLQVEEQKKANAQLAEKLSAMEQEDKSFAYPYLNRCLFSPYVKSEVESALKRAEKMEKTVKLEKYVKLLSLYGGYNDEVYEVLAKIEKEVEQEKLNPMLMPNDVKKSREKWLKRIESMEYYIVYYKPKYLAGKEGIYSIKFLDRMIVLITEEVNRYSNEYRCNFTPFISLLKVKENASK